MLQAAGSLASIAILLTAGLVLARKGMLGGRTVDGLKALITRVTLPLLLFRAFLQLEPEASNLTLAAAVFAACAVMGGIGVLLGRAVHLPRPETRLLFQGFEAGMLGYAFFIALHGSEHLPAFAALDMGQVVYVFTVLIVQMSILEQHNARAGAGEVPGTTAAPPRGTVATTPDDGAVAATGRASRTAVPTEDVTPAPSALAGRRPFAFPWRDIASSTVLWAIAAGLVLSWAAPGLARTIVAPTGPAAVVFDTVGGLTTPLVCLVIGASLAAGIPRDPSIVTIVLLRTVVGLGLGLLVGLVLVPALGFSSWYSRAAILLFVLPAPFVIPVYYKRNAAFLGSVLTLSTAVSIALIAVLAVLGLV